MKTAELKVGMRVICLPTRHPDSIIYTVVDKSEKFVWLDWKGRGKTLTPWNSDVGFRMDISTVSGADYILYTPPPPKPKTKEYDIVWIKNDTRNTISPVIFPVGRQLEPFYKGTEVKRETIRFE